MIANVPLKPYSTLRAGGNAEWFLRANTAEELASAALSAQLNRMTTTYLGGGSNILPSDQGVPGLTIINESSEIKINRETGEVEADAGCWFQELFLKTAQAGLGGLEFAVGIPGSLGGALVSNAGAYRSNVSEFLTEIEIVEGGVRRWENPNWMDFSYRDSVLRRPNPPACALIRVRLQMPHRSRKDSYDEAREYQRQRISKQPPPASAGSFFKNVNDPVLAERLETLPPKLREAGVVPAGYLIQHCGLMGYREGGAMFANRHANFIVNVAGASAYDIRRLATIGKKAVFEKFGVEMEEEVMYLGDWTRFTD